MTNKYEVNQAVMERFSISKVTEADLYNFISDLMLENKKLNRELSNASWDSSRCQGAN